MNMEIRIETMGRGHALTIEANLALRPGELASLDEAAAIRLSNEITNYVANHLPKDLALKLKGYRR